MDLEQRIKNIYTVKDIEDILAAINGVEAKGYYVTMLKDAILKKTSEEHPAAHQMSKKVLAYSYE